MIRPSKPAARSRIARVENERFAASLFAPQAGHDRSRPGSTLILRVRGRVIVVDEDAVDWVDGAGNYVRFHAGKEVHRVRGTMKDVERVLPPRFIRSHRSTIINAAAVHEFVRTPYGDLVAVLRAGNRLTVGRKYRGNVKAAFAVRQ